MRILCCILWGFIRKLLCKNDIFNNFYVNVPIAIKFSEIIQSIFLWFMDCFKNLKEHFSFKRLFKTLAYSKVWTTSTITKYLSNFSCISRHFRAIMAMATSTLKWGRGATRYLNVQWQCHKSKCMPHATSRMPTDVSSVLHPHTHTHSEHEKKKCPDSEYAIEWLTRSPTNPSPSPYICQTWCETSRKFPPATSGAKLLLLQLLLRQTTSTTTTTTRHLLHII